mmetsp:Transcript_14377/g.61680  ORF Transcript_14377/g.61680 Transcript_14377/m.61680 type:complete len:226 (-) Transcript_14377:1122-1799(-)
MRLHGVLDPGLVVTHHGGVLQAGQRGHLAEHARRRRRRNRRARAGGHPDLLDRVLAAVQAVHRERDSAERAAAELPDLLEISLVPRRRQRRARVGRRRGRRIQTERRQRRRKRRVSRRRLFARSFPEPTRASRLRVTNHGRSNRRVRFRFDRTVSPESLRRPLRRGVAVQPGGGGASLRVKRAAERAVKVSRSVQQNLAKPARQDAARAELRRERGKRMRQRTSI